MHLLLGKHNFNTAFLQACPTSKILSFAQQTRPQKEKGISVNLQNRPVILDAVEAPPRDSLNQFPRTG